MSLFIDRTDQLTPEQSARLDVLAMGIDVQTSTRVTGYGELTVFTEIEALSRILPKVQPGDYVAKVDSDVLFLTDSIFRIIGRTDADLIGHKETHWGELIAYTQGGCYFLSRQAVINLARLPPAAISDNMLNTYVALETAARRQGRTRYPDCPEDAAVHSLVRHSGGQVAFVPFHLPSRYKPRIVWSGDRWTAPTPTWREIAGRLRAHDMETLRQYFRLATDHYSIAHFWSKREMMMRVFHTRAPSIASAGDSPNTE